MSNRTEPHQPRRPSIWIVFSGHTDIPWLKLLKPGFRHCYALLNDGRQWVTFDPLSSYTDLQIHRDISPDYDLPGWLEHHGDHVVQANQITDYKRGLAISFYSCVEVMKRLLGIHCWHIITPWQLYQYLQNRKDFSYGTCI